MFIIIIIIIIIIKHKYGGVIQFWRHIWRIYRMVYLCLNTNSS